jgi:hypothetical protein
MQELKRAGVAMLRREKKDHFAESALFYQSITVGFGRKTLQCPIFLFKLAVLERFAGACKGGRGEKRNRTMVR